MPSLDFSRRRRWFAIGITLAGAIFFGGGYAVASLRMQSTVRQAIVEARGTQVMPFDQAATTHVFQKTSDGGVESVVANDPHDAAQVQLVRGHLLEETQKFRTGNYDDPARIHGMDMPGLKELATGYTRVAVTYQDLADGGRITYQTSEPALVDALHAWFDRQVSDHGSHAMPA